ncbi:hypothetical protein A2U01_0106135, partial [Trifolium medium]|nr:hypothetical protein [Trifolium medium]
EAKESDGHSESSSLQRQKATAKLKLPRFSERKRRKLQETENSLLEREKGTDTLLARWKGRWASKP